MTFFVYYSILIIFLTLYYYNNALNLMIMNSKKVLL